jgi:hypothetical protein
MARRIINRKELRAQFDAAESRKTDDEGEEREDDEEDEEDDDAEASDEEGEGDEEAEGDEDEEGAPKAKKKKKVVVKEPKPVKKKVAKHVRRRVIWGVFNNSNQRVATFEYAKKKEAEDHAAKLKADKNQTFFVQPVKENIEG